MGRIINLFIALIATMFILGAVIGTNYREYLYDDPTEANLQIEKEYEAYMNKSIVLRTPGNGWLNQSVIDYQNAAYMFSWTAVSWGKQYGYENPMKAYSYLVYAPITLAFGAELMFVIQYAIAMVWVGWDKIFGGKAT